MKRKGKISDYPSEVQNFLFRSQSIHLQLSNKWHPMEPQERATTALTYFAKFPRLQQLVIIDIDSSCRVRLVQNEKLASTYDEVPNLSLYLDIEAFDPSNCPPCCHTATLRWLIDLVPSERRFLTSATHCGDPSAVLDFQRDLRRFEILCGNWTSRLTTLNLWRKSTDDFLFDTSIEFPALETLVLGTAFAEQMNRTDVHDLKKIVVSLAKKSPNLQFLEIHGYTTLSPGNQHVSEPDLIEMLQWVADVGGWRKLEAIIYPLHLRSWSTRKTRDWERDLLEADKKSKRNLRLCFPKLSEISVHCHSVDISWSQSGLSSRPIGPAVNTRKEGRESLQDTREEEMHNLVGESHESLGSQIFPTADAHYIACEIYARLLPLKSFAVQSIPDQGCSPDCPARRERDKKCVVWAANCTKAYEWHRQQRKNITM